MMVRDGNSQYRTSLMHRREAILLLCITLLSLVTLAKEKELPEEDEE